MGDTSGVKPALAQRQPHRLSPEEIGDPFRPEVSAAEMQEILFALMEQQTR